MWNFLPMVNAWGLSSCVGNFILEEIWWLFCIFMTPLKKKKMWFTLCIPVGYYDRKCLEGEHALTVELGTQQGGGDLAVHDVYLVVKRMSGFFACVHRTVCWSTSGRMRSSTASTCLHKSWPTWTKKHQNSMALRLQTAQATRTSAHHLNIAIAMEANPGTTLQSSASLPFYCDHRHHHAHRSWDGLLSSPLGPTEAGRGVVTLFGAGPGFHLPASSHWTGTYCAHFFS